MIDNQSIRAVLKLAIKPISSKGSFCDTVQFPSGDCDMRLIMRLARHLSHQPVLFYHRTKPIIMDHIMFIDVFSRQSTRSNNNKKSNCDVSTH